MEPAANCLIFSLRESCQGTEQMFLVLLSKLSQKWWLNMIGAESREVWATSQKFAQFLLCWIETDGLKNNSSKVELKFSLKKLEKIWLKSSFIQDFDYKKWL